jgi:hypothetical protein
LDLEKMQPKSASKFGPHQNPSGKKWLFIRRKREVKTSSDSIELTLNKCMSFVDMHFV